MQLHKIYKLIPPEGKRRIMLSALQRKYGPTVHMREIMYSPPVPRRTQRQRLRHNSQSRSKSHIWWNMHARINN